MTSGTVTKNPAINLRRSHCISVDSRQSQSVPVGSRQANGGDGSRHHTRQNQKNAAAASASR
jgi:hypothetical protein